MTKRADLLIPEFIAPQIGDNFEINSTTLQMCDVDTSLQGNAGDELTIAKYVYGNSKCQKLKEGDTIDYKKLAMGSSKITLEQYASGYRIFDRALLATLGDPIGKMVQFIGGEITDTFDEDVIAVAKTTPLKFEVNNPLSITETEINEALNLYGDKQNYTDFEGIVIHPKLKSSFLNMESFTKTDSTMAKDGNGVIQNGVIGYWGGIIPVILSSKGTYDSVKQQCETFIIKKGSLLAVYKRTPNFEKGRDMDNKSWKVNDDMIGGIGLINEAGIVHLTKVFNK
ncbi:hypothetical protein RBU49_03045 [Clostridium sp. MB40-C1]|uniref:hypothetical protein n=1 Tax=Clostridium sp. MB40-C1 TaxID=3070996 RepID=UPI0027E10E23|nr:hypothetical protein [Clostridium sp. MB40-C1]WMJ81247.1 hypothetical protein RBU49_03045 [Clostridium sp. MB40-C1]